MNIRRFPRPAGLLASLVTAGVVSFYHVSLSRALSDSSSCTTGFGAVGNGLCDYDLNIEACGYDGGHCCSCTCVDGLSQTLDAPGLSSSSSSGVSISYGDCGDAGFACIDPSAECVDDDDVGSSTVDNCLANYIGDGYCDVANNNVACGYDGGDCCSCTCVDGPEYQCGAVGYSCTDPDAICVNDDDGDTSYPTGYGSTSPWLSDDSSPSWVYDDYYVDDSLGLGTCIILFVNDSYCDLTNNNEACGFDGGDCCPCTCLDTPTASFQCGEGGYVCVDPEVSCSSTDDAITLTSSEPASDGSLPSEPTTDDSLPASDNTPDTDDNQPPVVPPSDDIIDSEDGSPLPQSGAPALRIGFFTFATALVAAYEAIQCNSAA